MIYRNDPLGAPDLLVVEAKTLKQIFTEIKRRKEASRTTVVV